KHFINTFGEELIVDNADKAIQMACEKTHAMVNDYTAAPVYMDEHKQACHQWLIEFEKEPESLAYFTELLDNALKSCNSDYEAKRYKNMVLKMPLVQALPKGTFYKWMKKKGKLGGQHKVPRLANHREYVEEILQEI
ncbi:MAG: GH3 auxin-responsive promoter family protein, partial [Bacteroidales bacterium]